MALLLCGMAVIHGEYYNPSGMKINRPKPRSTWTKTDASGYSMRNSFSSGVGMFAAEIEEVLEVFRTARNTNAAIKKILKQEVKRGSPEERFFKDFRNAVMSPRAAEATEFFIRRHYPAGERYFMVIAGYVHDEAMVDISSRIIDQYAEEFNETYEQRDSDIEVRNSERFESLARAALEMIGLGEHNLPQNAFMKNVLINRLFTPEVIKKLDPLLQ